MILCTARYSDFCQRAYGTYLHHHPEGGAPDHLAAQADPMPEQLRRTVVAWSMVRAPGERCVPWDLDRVVGVEQPWGVDPDVVTSVESSLVHVRD